MTKTKALSPKGNIATLADIKPLLPAIYSASAAEAMASTLDRAVRLTGMSSLSQIPADVVAWEGIAATIVWAGKFSAPTLAKAKKDFDKFVSRVSAIIRRAHQFTGPAAPVPAGVQVHWDAIADHVGAHGVTSRKRVFAPKCERASLPAASKPLAELRIQLALVPPLDRRSLVKAKPSSSVRSRCCSGVSRRSRSVSSVATGRRSGPSGRLALPAGPPSRLGCIAPRVGFRAGRREALDRTDRRHGGPRGRSRSGRRGGRRVGGMRRRRNGSERLDRGLRRSGDRRFG